MARAAATTERTLTQRALNRALLARQSLLGRSSISIVEAVEAVGGLQTQTHRLATSGCGVAWRGSGGRT